MRLNVYVGLRAIAYIITRECNVVKHGIKSVNISHTNYYEYLAGLPVSFPWTLICNFQFIEF